jgi:hypothetical protein
MSKLVVSPTICSRLTLANRRRSIERRPARVRTARKRSSAPCKTGRLAHKASVGMEIAIAHATIITTCPAAEG